MSACNDVINDYQYLPAMYQVYANREVKPDGYDYHSEFCDLTGLTRLEAKQYVYNNFHRLVNAPFFSCMAQ